jgi:hypothetical protein
VKFRSETLESVGCIFTCSNVQNARMPCTGWNGKLRGHLSEADVDAIQAYVIDQAWQGYNEQEKSKAKPPP